MGGGSHTRVLRLAHELDHLEAAAIVDEAVVVGDTALAAGVLHVAALLAHGHLADGALSELHGVDRAAMPAHALYVGLVRHGRAPLPAGTPLRSRRPGVPYPRYRPTDSATGESSAINALSPARSSDCGPSDSAWRGSGWASTMIPSAPTATAARATAGTRSACPHGCETSTMIGSIDSLWTTGTAVMSSVQRVAV